MVARRIGFAAFAAAALAAVAVLTYATVIHQSYGWYAQRLRIGSRNGGTFLVSPHRFNSKPECESALTSMPKPDAFEPYFCGRLRDSSARALAREAGS
ncbi:MAG TPA: hypothetical protein VFL13_15600 [Candidatus Baltobacteraceae bacterium]|nr:hypothetical protein [Candidatus Baltobacteraceae bacterium]